MLAADTPSPPPLLCVQDPVLARVWPASRVVLGMRVCRRFRTELPVLAKSVLLKPKWILEKEPEATQVAKDLQRFSQTGQLALCMDIRAYGGVTAPQPPRQLVQGLLMALKANLKNTLSELVMMAQESTFGQPWMATLVPEQSAIVFEEAFFDSLNFCSGLETLKLQGSWLHSEGASKLADAISTCSSLSSLQLSTERAGAVLSAQLSGALTSTLSALDLSCAGIDGQSVTWLGPALAGCPSLTSLKLSGNTFLGSHFNAFTTNLACSTLTHLSVCDMPKFKNDGTAGLANVLHKCCALSELVVTNCGMQCEGIERMADNLAALQPAGQEARIQLTLLDLQRNSIRVDGAGRLFGMLQPCTTLTELNMSCNLLGPGGAEVLASQLLRSLPRLISLHLGMNYLGDAGATSVAMALDRCPMLETLELWRNDIQDEGVAALTAQLARCPRLRVLSLGQNKVADAGATTIAVALGQRGGSMQQLDLGHNCVQAPGLEQLEALRSCIAELWLNPQRPPQAAR